VRILSSLEAEPKPVEIRALEQAVPRMWVRSEKVIVRGYHRKRSAALLVVSAPYIA
jgi:hypothetical protein